MKESSSFSWTKVLKTCDNNEKLAKTMLERFDQLYFEDAIKQLHESITKGDNTDISTQLHSLWTNFLYIGAINGETIVKEMETIVSQKNKNELAGAYLELLDEMKEIKKQVSKNLNNSPKTQDIEQYEQEIAKTNPQAKQTALRAKVPGTSEINKSSKVIHTKLVQEKIRMKELELDPTRLQMAYSEIKSPEFAVPKSRILDFAQEQNQQNFAGTAIPNETAYKSRNVASGIGAYQAHDLSEIKMNQNGNTNQAGFELKQENNMHNKPNSNLNPMMQRLVQAAMSLSYDKILLELKQFNEILKGSSQAELIAVITKLETSASKQIKNLTIDQTITLIKETKRLRSNLAQAKFEVPTADELDKYEKDIRQKFSHNNEFGVEVALEGKKDSSKTNCCSLF